MNAAWTAYRWMAPALGAAAPAARWFAPARERSLWRERLGHVGGGEPADAWVHAASLGEAMAVGPLVSALRGSRPAARVHLTANTIAGRGRLAALAEPHSFAPLDAPQAIGRFLAGVRPRRMFLIETELWPHWLLAAEKGAMPVAVVSARLSPGSAARYARLGEPFRALVRGLGAVLCQTAADEGRWRELGARPERTTVVGNLKDDALPGPAEDRDAARARLGLDPSRPLLVLASLRPGELGIVAEAWRRVPEVARRDWQVVALPRHARAAAGLRAEAERAGQALAADGPPPERAWRWDERIGVLAGYYAVADLAVVGGSFAPHGGHNPLEPAACGAAVIIGPHHWTQADAVAALTACGGGRVAEDASQLAAALRAWLEDGRSRRAAAAAAMATVRSRRGAAARAVERLIAWDLWPAA